jgi:hypothetical protein
MYGMANLQCPEHSDVSLTQHGIEHLQIETFINVYYDRDLIYLLVTRSLVFSYMGFKVSAQ